MRNGRLRTFQIIGLIWTLGVNLSADAGLFGSNEKSWKEEVLLHDGRIIIVDRTANRHGGHEIGQRPPIGDQSISFTMPGTKRRAVWKDDYSEDVRGANFNLMMLDIVQGTAYVLATPAGCLSYNKWGRPNPPYVVFEYQDHEWKRIPLEELPPGIKLPNMLHASPDEVAEERAIGGVVSASAIREENDGYKQPEYKTIVREVVKRGGITRCEEMIRVKDGWVSPGGAKAPIPIRPRTPDDANK